MTLALAISKKKNRARETMLRTADVESFVKVEPRSAMESFCMLLPADKSSILNLSCGRYLRFCDQRSPRACAKVVFANDMMRLLKHCAHFNR